VNLNHLRWALEVERTGSFTAAAANLFIAQSNLSNGIKSLEESVGFRIFARKSRGVETTPLGRDFLTSARQAVYHLQSLEASYEKRVFSFAVHRHCDFVADALARVSLRHAGEGIRFIVKECAEEDILDSIHSGECMFGVDFYPEESERFLRHELMERNLTQEIVRECGMYILLGRGHPLAGMKEFPSEELYNWPMVAFSENESRGVSFDAQAKAVGLELARFHTMTTLGDRASLYRYLKESGGIFLTGLTDRRERELYGLTALPVEGFVRKYSVITPKGVKQPALCLELIEEIKKAAEKME